MAKLSIEFRGGPRQQRQPSHTAYEPVLAWKNYNSSVNHVSHFPYFLEPEECWEDHPTSESERELVRNQTETCHFCRQPEKAQSRRGVASFFGVVCGSSSLLLVLREEEGEKKPLFRRKRRRQERKGEDAARSI